MAQTGSFIPKRSTGNNRGTAPTRIYLLSYISYVVFFSTLLAVAALFLYELQLSSSLENQKNQLSVERDSFSPSDIEQVRELEKRLVIAENLLNAQVAPSQLFAALEQITLRSVQITNFTVEQQLNGLYNVKAEGITTDFDALLFQRDILDAQAVFANAVIEEVALGSSADSSEGTEGEEDTVTFLITTDLRPSEIAYEVAPAVVDTPVLDVPEISDTTAPAIATTTPNETTN